MVGHGVKKGTFIVIFIVFGVLSIYFSESMEIRGGTLEDITGKVTYGEFYTGLCVSTPVSVSDNCAVVYRENDTINCSITVSGHNNTGFSSIFIKGNTLFVINDTTGAIYKDILNFSDIGNYTVLIYYNFTNECGYSGGMIVYSFEVKRVTNHPPVCYKNITNKEITQGSSLLIKMGTYCEDPDGDPLTYSVWVDRAYLGFGIDIVGDELSLVTDSWFYGDIYMSFNATDIYNTSDSTNIFKISVKQIQPSSPQETSSPGSSKTSSSLPNSLVLSNSTVVMCLPKWNCTNWGACFPEGQQYRECVDLNNCNSTILKPNTTQNCTYTPTCFDGVMNGNETGVDCGGSCSKTCTEPATCFDGVKNGDEQGIDCGGSCSKTCPVVQQPISIGSLKNMWWWLLAISALLTGYYIIKKIPRKLKFRKIRGALGKKTSANDLLSRLDDVEKNILKSRTKVTLSRTAEVIEDYLILILQSEQISNEEELRLKINNSKIKDGLKTFILGIYTDLLEIEFSEEEISKIQALLFIYESKNMIITTLHPTGYTPKEITDLVPHNEEEKIFKLISLANYDLIKGTPWDKNKIKELKKVLLSKDIKNKFLINSYNRLLKLEWNKYAEKK